ncbi:MAG TPA: orotidine-5'-phosphate decarboxylase [Candidatus Paceibacterota bacterium]
MNNTREKIIVAIDTDNLRTARYLVKNLLPYAEHFKIGLELSSAVGAPHAIEMVHKLGGKVFYDGKFNDISNTVGKATKAISNLGVSMFDVHASSGPESVRSAVQNKGKSKVLGVTILTSLDEKGDMVLRLAEMLRKEGVDGIVCSPWEIKLIRKYKKFNQLLIVTPGIRPKWAPIGDQKRFMTPFEAVRAGADYLVIGRPITNPPISIGTPLEAIKLIHKELI